jgi:hypothetical protein
MRSRVLGFHAPSHVVSLGNGRGSVPKSAPAPVLVTALYYCRYRRTGYESGTIRCTFERDLLECDRTPRLVRFVTGS